MSSPSSGGIRRTTKNSPRNCPVDSPKRSFDRFQALFRTGKYPHRRGVRCKGSNTNRSWHCCLAGDESSSPRLSRLEEHASFKETGFPCVNVHTSLCTEQFLVKTFQMLYHSPVPLRGLRSNLQSTLQSKLQSKCYVNPTADDCAEGHGTESFRMEQHVATTSRFPLPRSYASQTDVFVARSRIVPSTR